MYYGSTTRSRTTAGYNPNTGSTGKPRTNYRPSHAHASDPKMKYVYCDTCNKACTFEEHDNDIMHDSSEHTLGKGGDHTVIGARNNWKLPDDVEWFTPEKLEVRAE